MSWFSCISLLVKPFQVEAGYHFPSTQLVLFFQGIFTLYQQGSKLHATPYASLLPFLKRIEFALKKHLKLFYRVFSSQEIQRPDVQPGAFGLFQNSHSVSLLLRRVAFWNCWQEHPFSTMYVQACHRNPYAYKLENCWVLFRIMLFLTSKREHNLLI